MRTLSPRTSSRYPGQAGKPCPSNGINENLIGNPESELLLQLLRCISRVGLVLITMRSFDRPGVRVCKHESWEMSLLLVREVGYLQVLQPGAPCVIDTRFNSTLDGAALSLSIISIMDRQTQVDIDIYRTIPVVECHLYP